MKRVIIALLYWSGIVSLVRLRHKHRLVILLYHGVAPAETAGIFNYRKKFILPESFERQITFLQRKYTILELDEAIARLHAGTLPPYALVVTFDDGYQNVYDYAFPILREHGVSATVFLASNFVMRHEPLWVDRLEYAVGFGGSESKAEKIHLDLQLRETFKSMSDEQKLRELAQIEMGRGAKLTNDAHYAPLTHSMIAEMRPHNIAFGAHTKSHPILTQVARAKVDNEIAGSKRELEAWCGPLSNTFAYPNGQPNDFNPHVIEVIKNAGFSAAVTTIQGLNDPKTPPYELRRYTLDNTDNWAQFMLGLSGLKQWIKRG